MKEFVYYNSLFDIYGKLLTEKEQESFRDYYQEDLSLGEIAEIKNIAILIQSGDFPMTPL